MLFKQIIHFGLVLSIKLTVHGAERKECGVALSSQLYPWSHSGSSDGDKRSDGMGGGLLGGPPRSACLIVYGRVAMWDAQDVFYARDSGQRSGYRPVWCSWQAALLCVSRGVWARECLTEPLRRAHILCGNYSLCVPVSVAGWLSCSTSAHPLLNTAPDCR